MTHACALNDRWLCPVARRFMDVAAQGGMVAIEAALARRLISLPSRGPTSAGVPTPLRRPSAAAATHDLHDGCSGAEAAGAGGDPGEIWPACLSRRSRDASVMAGVQDVLPNGGGGGRCVACVRPPGGRDLPPDGGATCWHLLCASFCLSYFDV